MTQRTAYLLFLLLPLAVACGEKPRASAPSSPTQAPTQEEAADEAKGDEASDEDDDIVPPPDSPDYAPLD